MMMMMMMMMMIDDDLIEFSQRRTTDRTNLTHHTEAVNEYAKL